MYNGAINVYKEAGFTSFDVVAKLRGILRQKKIGHTGTLDPDAEGVLLVCLGNATKLVEQLVDKVKVYECVMRLGVETDTEDMSGEVLKTSAVDCTSDYIRSAAMSFVGGYDQLPPMYSALKVNGRKLCDIARAGGTAQRTPRHVDIHSIEIKDIDRDRVTMSIECGKGTYIRSLCRDIGEKLGCGAAMEHLIRTRSGDFYIDKAYKLSEIEAAAKNGSVGDLILPTETFFMGIPAFRVKPEKAAAIDNGNMLPAAAFDDAEKISTKDGERIRVINDRGNFVAVYAYKSNRGAFVPEKMFL
ncbi:MAG: tRNA pseudouridine(55) synthase TruB [Lachnospiraceae bacterium]|nr:tRNA pseudouridine(55) synthase TruB [Lachnospiraceae bacterium]